jgi:hypothetical protein
MWFVQGDGPLPTGVARLHAHQRAGTLLCTAHLKAKSHAVD